MQKNCLKTFGAFKSHFSPALPLEVGLKRSDFHAVLGL